MAKQPGHALPPVAAPPHLALCPGATPPCQALCSTAMHPVRVLPFRAVRRKQALLASTTVHPLQYLPSTAVRPHQALLSHHRDIAPGPAFHHRRGYEPDLAHCSYASAEVLALLGCAMPPGSIFRTQTSRPSPPAILSCTSPPGAALHSHASLWRSAVHRGAPHQGPPSSSMVHWCQTCALNSVTTCYHLFNVNFY